MISLQTSNLLLNRFVVRDFTYNEEKLAAGKNEITKLATDKKKQFVSGRLSDGGNSLGKTRLVRLILVH